MNLTTYVLIAVAMVLAAIAGFFRSPMGKGIMGEFLVNLATKLFLDGKVYHLVKDVTLPTADGTTQIDHVIVSVHGIFVVETKNMRGWIFGSEMDTNWTQKIFKSKHTFQNPLRQNYKHTETLKELLGLPGNVVKSVIVFIGDSTFKTKMPANVVEGGMGYCNHIKTYREEVLTPEAVEEILAVIQENRLQPGIKTHVQHVQHLKDKFSEDAPATVAPPVANAQPSPSEDRPGEAQAPACPKCGAEMVLRTAKCGKSKGEQFWGCPNYPKCRSMLEAS